MTRYYFDVREEDHFTPDAEGQEIPTSDAWMEAARTLAELARETIPRHRDGRHRMAIEVRDDNGPVLAVRLVFATDSKP